MAALVQLGLAPLWRAPLAVMHLVRFVHPLADMRVVLAATLAHLVRAACEALFRGIVSQAFRGARYAHDITTAATMVAAVEL